jgi:sulfur-carrier protein
MPNTIKITIKITVKLFAIYQETFQASERYLELPIGSTVSDVADRLIADRPELAAWREITQFGVNCDRVTPSTILQDGDEVVLIPPVSGG